MAFTRLFFRRGAKFLRGGAKPSQGCCAPPLSLPQNMGKVIVKQNKLMSQPDENRLVGVGERE